MKLYTLLYYVIQFYFALFHFVLLRFASFLEFSLLCFFAKHFEMKMEWNDICKYVKLLETDISCLKMELFALIIITYK